MFTPLFEAFGFREPSLYSLIVILSFILGPFTFFFKPFFTKKSRKNEYEADRYAAEIINTSEPLKEALICLGKENLSNLTPHKTYSFFHYSHPVLSERIEALNKLGE
jgi:STE24 endopeptidase